MLLLIFRKRVFKICIFVSIYAAVPESEVCHQFMDATGLRNIGYKYFDRSDFTYLSHLSMGMLDNMFCSQSMYQKVQDAKIDYSHKPIWPSSNHLPMVIDVDTTWYGGWGSPKLSPPLHKSILPQQREGEQDLTRRSGELRTPYDNYDHNGYAQYLYHVYDDPVHMEHSKYIVKPQQKPPEQVMSKANVIENDYDQLDSKYMNGFSSETMDGYRGWFANYGTWKLNEVKRKGIYWVLDALKWTLYTLIGVTCLLIGICIGWWSVGYWRNYKGSVVRYRIV